MLASSETVVVQSGVRFRAYPDPAMATTLRQWIGCQRMIYNAKVHEHRLAFALRNLAKEFGPQLPIDVHSQYSGFKDPELTPWLSDVPSQILRNGVTRWRDAMDRFRQGLSKAPTHRNRYTFNTVTVSSELFRFVEKTHPTTQKRTTFIELGTQAHPIGLLKFKAHRPFSGPKTLCIRVEGLNTWHISFCYEHALTQVNDQGVQHEVILRQPHELAYELQGLPPEVLEAKTIGLDRNVRDNLLATSEGDLFALSPVQIERLHRKDKARKRYQRKLARCKKGSKNAAKLRKRVAATYTYGRNVRRDTAHQISHRLVNSEAVLLVAEKLNIASLTKRPAPRQDEHGTYLPNNAKAKAALHRKVLGSCWGNIVRFTAYKAARINKLLVTVDPRYTSQECSRCEHIHPDNRSNQGSIFHCQACGFRDHADLNASAVIKKRGMKALREGLYNRAKVKKTVGAYKKRKTNLAAEASTPKDPSGTAGGHPVAVCGGHEQAPKGEVFPKVMESLLSSRKLKA